MLSDGNGTLAHMSPIPGFRSHVASVGIKDSSLDFAVVIGEPSTTCAGVFTRSRFAGPSVELSRESLAAGGARGLVVVSKNANVANGERGRRDAEELRRGVAERCGVLAESLLVASTGVIGRPYPMDRIRGHLRSVDVAEPARLDLVADAIMTTDTVRKLSQRRVGDCSIVGIAKGVGMIEPNMATLLTFFFTDAAISRIELDALFRRVVDKTFNALSIDTDTSTSDSAAIFASGVGGPVDLAEFESAAAEVATELVMSIASDGEGASKAIVATVTGARDVEQARRVAKSIVNSPLVKTAVHGADPNWGRIAMAVGKCEDDLDIDQNAVVITIGGVELYPASADDALAAAAAHLAGKVVRLGVDLGLADGHFTAYGCDLTDGYVRINADYTT